VVHWDFADSPVPTLDASSTRRGRLLWALADGEFMTKSPQRRDSKKVGKTLQEKREAKRVKASDKKPLER